jgi:hypothetical protein
MIRFLASSVAGAPVVGLGLSDDNVERLRAGQPIYVRLRDLLPDSDIELLIFAAGLSEVAMIEHLAGLLGPTTRTPRA